MNRDEKVMKVAAILKQARQCEPEGMPCPFCLWDSSALEESGCIYWARQIVDALDAAHDGKTETP